MPEKQTPEEINALLDEAPQRPEQVVPICLRGDLTAKIIELDEKLGAIGQETSDLRITGNPEAVAISQQIKDLQAEAEKKTIRVLLRALPRKEWADLVAKHPPKTKGQGENFDWSIFNDAVPACWVEPQLDKDRLEKFLDSLTQGQWDQLAWATNVLNVGEGAVPFSQRASRVLRSSDESPKPQETTG